MKVILFLIKLPFKILAGIMLLLLGFVSVAYGVLKQLGAVVLSLVFAFFIISDVVMFVRGDWLNVGVATALAFGLFLCMLAAELVEAALNGLLDLLGTFVWS